MDLQFASKWQYDCGSVSLTETKLVWRTALPVPETLVACVMLWVSLWVTVIDKLGVRDWDAEPVELEFACEHEGVTNAASMTADKM